MKTDDAWKATTAVMWYVSNQPFERWFARVFPEFKEPPPGCVSHYKREWQNRWERRDIGALFGHLDFEHQQRFIAEVLRVYDEETERALETAKARRRPDSAGEVVERLSNDPNLSPSYRAALRDAGRGHLVR